MIVPQEIQLIGQPVRSLQTMLRALSYRYAFLPRLTPDGVFGERTLEAVMLFQRQLHPPVTGRVDQSTWDAIVSAYQSTARQLAGPRPFRGWPEGGYTVEPGASSVHLALVQTMFQSLAGTFPALAGGGSTGVNDSGTAGDLRWLQRAAGLPETGTMDQDSWNALSRLYTLFLTHPPASS